MTSKTQARWEGILQGRQAKGQRTRTKRRRNTKQEERCNQVHNQAASRRMEMMMMSTMLKGYQKGDSGLTARDHIRVYPLTIIQ